MPHANVHRNALDGLAERPFGPGGALYNCHRGHSNRSMLTPPGGCQISAGANGIVFCEWLFPLLCAFRRRS